MIRKCLIGLFLTGLAFGVSAKDVEATPAMLAGTWTAVDGTPGAIIFGAGGLVELKPEGATGFKGKYAVTKNWLEINAPGDRGTVTMRISCREPRICTLVYPDNSKQTFVKAKSAKKR